MGCGGGRTWHVGTWSTGRCAVGSVIAHAFVFGGHCGNPGKIVLGVAVVAPGDGSVCGDAFDGVMPGVLGPCGLGVVFAVAYIHT